MRERERKREREKERERERKRERERERERGRERRERERERERERDNELVISGTSTLNNNIGVNQTKVVKMYIQEVIIYTDINYNCSNLCPPHTFTGYISF